MKVYVVTKDKGDSEEYDEVCPIGLRKVFEVYRDKERAYRAAHNQQLIYLRNERILYEQNTEDSEDESSSIKYTRDARDRSWVISFGKVMRLTKGESCTRFTVRAYNTK